MFIMFGFTIMSMEIAMRIFMWGKRKVRREV